MASIFRNLTVRARILAVLGVCLATLIVTSTASIYLMARIGVEVESISEREVPLIDKLTVMTTHQLEMAIAFERALRFRLAMKDSDPAKSKYKLAVKAFDSHAGKMDEEITQAGDLAENSIKAAASEVERQEMRRVLGELKTIKTQRAAFNKRAHEIFASRSEGHTEDAVKIEAMVVEDADKLDKHVEKLLLEVELFVEAAAKTAGERERTTIWLIWIMTIVAIVLVLAISWFLVRGIPLTTIVARRNTAANTNAVEPLSSIKRGGSQS